MNNFTDYHYLPAMQTDHQGKVNVFWISNDKETNKHIHKSTKGHFEGTTLVYDKVNDVELDCKECGFVTKFIEDYGDHDCHFEMMRQIFK